MPGRLPVVRSRDLIRALAKEGWYLERTTGHAILRHPDRAVSVPVPNHPGEELTRKTLRSILAATGITPDRLRELL
jgi:predicted RNA binding protein YcfA (HicA-like mRNA interferase family)